MLFGCTRKLNYKLLYTIKSLCCQVFHNDNSIYIDKTQNKNLSWNTLHRDCDVKYRDNYSVVPDCWYVSVHTWFSVHGSFISGTGESEWEGDTVCYYLWDLYPLAWCWPHESGDPGEGPEGSATAPPTQWALWPIPVVFTFICQEEICGHGLWWLSILGIIQCLLWF